MASKVLRACGVLGVSLSMLFSLAVGCGKEQPPPAAQAPPAAVVPAQSAPAAGTPAPSVNQLQIGMTSEQVRQIMGVPGQIKQEGSELDWKYFTPQGKVEVEFVNNLATKIEKD